MPQFTQDSQESIRKLGLSRHANGFILLEVLLAMSLVATSWMALENSFQRLILRLGQLQEKRVQTQKELDQFEMALFSKRLANNEFNYSKGFLNEPAGMSRRSHTFSRSSHTTYQK
jgi:hypothetical protein